MRNAILIIVLARSTPGSRLLSRIHIFQIEVLDHPIRRRKFLLHAGRENLLEHFDIVDLAFLGEFDVELDVQVAEVVVAHGGHALAFDAFDGVCARISILDED
jgi:hypothetical protein